MNLDYEEGGGLGSPSARARAGQHGAQGHGQAVLIGGNAHGQCNQLLLEARATARDERRGRLQALARVRALEAEVNALRNQIERQRSLLDIKGSGDLDVQSIFLANLAGDS